MVLEGILKRNEFQSTVNNLQWAKDGSLFLNSTPKATIMKPKYIKNDDASSELKVKSAIELFEFVDKVAPEEFVDNLLYQSEPADEQTTTIFSNPETTIAKASWSPVEEQQGASYLGLLTNHASFLVLMDGLVKFDLTPMTYFESNDGLRSSITQSFNWIKIDSVLYVVAGFNSGEVRITKLQNNLSEPVAEFKVADNPIVKIVIDDHHKNIVLVTSKNEIFHSYISQDVQLLEFKELETQSRFLIYDLIIKDDCIFYTVINKFVQLDIKTLKKLITETKFEEFNRIIPIPNTDLNMIIGVSNSIIINNKTREFRVDDILQPILKKRLTRWKNNFNDFKTRNPFIRIIGVDTNFSNDVLSILYEIDENEGLSYKIASESIHYLLFVPFTELSSGVVGQSGSSLASYQKYLLTGNLRSSNLNTIENIDYSTNLVEFLIKTFLQNNEIKNLISENIIKRNNDEKIFTFLAKQIVSYIKSNKIVLNNDLDKACYLSFLQILNEMDETNLPNGPIEIFGDSFSESFDFLVNNDPNTIVSVTGHVWQRCSITKLPILTPYVKYDPITEKRILDISRDVKNEYGNLTYSILTVLNNVSIYSGCRYVTK